MSTKGSWKAKNSGGNIDHPTWIKNPQYLLSGAAGEVEITLGQRRPTHSIGFYVFEADCKVDDADKEALLGESPFKKRRDVSLTLELNEAKNYVVVCCAQEKGDEGRFTLTATAGEFTDAPDTPEESEEESSSVETDVLAVDGVWAGDQAAGSKKLSENPQIFLNSSHKTHATITVRSDSQKNIGVAVVKVKGEVQPFEGRISSKQTLAKELSTADEVRVEVDLTKGNFAIIPYTKRSGKEGDFNIEIRYADGTIEQVGVEQNEESSESDVPAEQPVPETTKDEPTKEIENNGENDDLLNELEHTKHALEETNTAISTLEAEVEALRAQLSAKDQEIENIKNQPEEAEPEVVDPTTISYEQQVGQRVVINSEWKEESAAGCMNHLSWRYNPQIFFTVSQNSHAKITLSTKGSKHPMSFYLYSTNTPNVRRLLINDDSNLIINPPFKKTSEVTVGADLLKTKNQYVIIPCTFDPNQEGGFKVVIESEATVSAQLLSPKSNWKLNLGGWTDETAGGAPGSEGFTRNPQYLLSLKKETKVEFTLLQTESEDFDGIAVYVVKAPSKTNQKLVKIGPKDIVANSEFESENESTFSATLESGNYVVIPCTYEQDMVGNFEIGIFGANGSIPVKELADTVTITLEGEFNTQNFGGSLPKDPASWRKNTQYALTVRKDLDLTIRVKQTSGEKMSLGFYVIDGGQRALRVKKQDVINKTSKFVQKEVLKKMSFGAREEPYIIVPSSLRAEKEGTYILQVLSDDPEFINDVTLEVLPQELDYYKSEVKGEWEGESAAGCLNHYAWRNNPQYHLQVKGDTDVVMFLSAITDSKEIAPGFYVVRVGDADEVAYPLNGFERDDIYVKGHFRKQREICKKFSIECGSYIILPCTYEAGFEAGFNISVYSKLDLINLQPLETELLTIDSQWTEQNAGGQITDNMENWLTNPRFYITCKQHVKFSAILIQDPNNGPDLDNPLPIGYYITPSDGEGNPKTNEETDLISSVGFSPDQDVYGYTSLESSPYSYVITPCTYKPGLIGDFKLQLLVRKQDAELILFTQDPVELTADDILDAGITPVMRRINEQFERFTNNIIQLVEMTENSEGVVEHVQLAGRNLLGMSAQLRASLVAWVSEEEPQWYIDHKAWEDYEEEWGGEEEEYEEFSESEEKPVVKPPPPPPPINFSVPPKVRMVEVGSTSSMTQEMIDDLENKSSQGSYDDVLMMIRGGLANLKSVKDRELPPKPVVENPMLCAFNLVDQLMERRAVVEGEGQDDSDSSWSDWSD
eukprot:TRINITY_DN3002_c0_g1_i1.p1 TRINITY_DN3002_c0_g1~~TRINITY_DN3002_c0_g1_i1.p1  ORF type:complete len:1270 (+),score=375.17 TRINITY_DN3002_c0_g1_i1:27-3836(+)